MRSYTHEMLTKRKHKLVHNNGKVAIYINRGQVDGNAVLTCYIITKENTLVNPDRIVRRSGEVDNQFLDQLVFWSFRVGRIEQWENELVTLNQNYDLINDCAKAVDFLFSETPWSEIQGECLAIALESICN